MSAVVFPAYVGPKGNRQALRCSNRCTASANRDDRKPDGTPFHDTPAWLEHCRKHVAAAALRNWRRRCFSSVQGPLTSPFPATLQCNLYRDCRHPLATSRHRCGKRTRRGSGTGKDRHNRHLIACMSHDTLSQLDCDRCPTTCLWKTRRCPRIVN